MKLVEIKNYFVLDTPCELLMEKELSDKTRCFIDAPDEVCGGWGYFEGQFIKPQPPQGWTYIDEKNCFAPIDMNVRKELGMRTDI